MVGDHIFFQGKEYVIVHRYSSDYCEIQEVNNPFNIVLVHISEITNITLR